MLKIPQIESPKTSNLTIGFQEVSNSLYFPCKSNEKKNNELNQKMTLINSLVPHDASKFQMQVAGALAETVSVALPFSPQKASSIHNLQIAYT